MADKSISDLTQATQITNDDLFVLQQSGEAKKLTGETLLEYVTMSVMDVSVVTLPAGSQATATYTKSTGTLVLGLPAGEDGKTGPANTLSIGTVTGGDAAAAEITGDAPEQTLNLTLPKGEQGDPGTPAPTITSIAIRQSDYHMIVTLSDGTSLDAGYCRGQAGAGTGDMLISVYDTQGKNTDIFTYTDSTVTTHNSATDAHQDIRDAIPTKTSELTNDSGFITDAPTIPSTTNLLKGDGSGGVSAATANSDYTTPANVRTILNRTNNVNVANTSYTTYMARGEALFSSETTPTVNGTIAWQYE